MIIPPSSTISKRTGSGCVETAAEPPEFPLVERYTELQPGRQAVAECQLDPTQDPFLIQHRLRDRPLLPFVVELEMMAEAAQRLAAPSRVTYLEDVEIVNGLRFFTDASQVVKAKVLREESTIQVELTADFRNRAGKLVQPDRPCARAVAHVSDRAVDLECPFPGEPEPWSDVWYPAEREEVLYHGPIFRRLEGLRFHDNGGWARITAAPLSDVAGHRRATGWLHSPATLDACLFACGIYPWYYQGKVVAIPHSLKRIHFGRVPRAGEVCVMHFQYLGRQDTYCDFHFVLFGADRRPLIRVERFRASIIPSQMPEQR